MDNNNNNNNKILSELYKLQDERQYKEIATGTIKIKQECEDLQKQINNLSIGKNSEEFNKIPWDIKSLVKENIYDEKRYLKDKKIENLNKLSELHLKSIDLLLKSKHN